MKYAIKFEGLLLRPGKHEKIKKHSPQEREKSFLFLIRYIFLVIRGLSFLFCICVY